MANIITTLPLIAENFQFRDALDIIIVSFLIYGFLLLLQRTHSRFIINGISILLGIYLIARYLDLYLTSILFQTFFTFFVVILVVIFQRELRSFFEWIYIWGKFSSQKTTTYSDTLTDQIIQAVDQLAQKNIGALIVLPGKQMIDALVQGGIGLNGKLSVPLLLSIFDPSSPGHDGAIIIEADRVKKFGAHLPLADRFEAYQGLGTRHRAALGLAERSDAVIIIVSEEKGSISVAYEGKLKVLDRSDELIQVIQERLQKKYTSHLPAKSQWHSFITHNIREKALSLAFTLFFWYIFVIQLGTGVVSHAFDVPVEFRFLPQQYIITKQSTNTVTVSLTGRSQDFALLDSKKNLQVVIDLSKPQEGYQRIIINTEDIIHPAALSVTKFSPTMVDFQVEKSIESVKE
ncbi:MAG: diadenylate cyclase CdaA [Patescibacteria group bacterium]